jgi:hypothetical protein
MFLGHIGLALAAKRGAPAVAGYASLAAQLPDGLWPLFLLGWEVGAHRPASRP